MLNKEQQKKSVEAMLQNSNLDEAQMRSLVATLNVNRRWAKTKKGDEERKAWGQKLLKARRAKKLSTKLE